MLLRLGPQAPRIAALRRRESIEWQQLRAELLRRRHGSRQKPQFSRSAIRHFVVIHDTRRCAPQDAAEFRIRSVLVAAGRIRRKNLGA
jgi:hypothetical protein